MLQIFFIRSEVTKVLNTMSITVPKTHWIQCFKLMPSGIPKIVLLPFMQYHLAARFCVIINYLCAKCVHIIHLWGSATRLGYFRNVLASNFLSKVAQICSKFLGYFENCHFLRKLLEKLGLLIPKSGHTDCSEVKV